VPASLHCGVLLRFLDRLGDDLVHLFRVNDGLVIVAVLVIVVIPILVVFVLLLKKIGSRALVPAVLVSAYRQRAR
jgi:uncharacterized membrane protein